LDCNCDPRGSVGRNNKLGFYNTKAEKMIEKYKKKLVISGKIAELYQYRVWHFLGFEPGKRFMKKKDREVMVRSKFAVLRASQNVRNLVNCNVDLNKFLTLTFKQNVKDLSFANYEFKKFIQKLKYKYGSFKYIAIVEFQERGSIHYHLVYSLKYVHFSIISKMWGHGSIEIKKVNSVRNLGVYFAKHGSKDNYNIESKSLAGNKKFFCSKGLKRPVEIYDKEEIKKVLLNKFFQNNVLIENNYVSENGDFVRYIQFKL